MCAMASDNEGVTFTLHRHEFALEAIPCYWPFVWRFPYQASMLCTTFNNALWHIACQVIWGGVGWGGGGVGTFTYQLCIMRNSYLKPFHVTGPSCGESTEAARSTLLLCMMCDSHWRPHHICNPLRTSHAVERGALCHWNANFDSFCDVLWLFHRLRAQLNLQDICQPLVQLLYPRPTKLEGGYTGFTLSVCPSVYMKKTRKKKQVCGAACFMAAEIKFSEDVRPSVCRRHGFRSISQVCFGISISNFICMLMVAIGRSLLIFSDITFKMAAWRPYWIFWFPDSNFTLALNINFKLQRHNTYVYG